MKRASSSKAPTAGFTLFEALLATALIAMILGALASVTAQWLPNWNRSANRVQRNEHIAIGLERLSADLAAAQHIPAHRETTMPFFDGGPRDITFIRTALGPNAGSGLEVVRLAEVRNVQGLAIVRSRLPFSPAITVVNRQLIQFADPVVLLRIPYRLSFAYAGRDRVWRDEWRSHAHLPQAIKLTLHDAAGQQLFFSTAVQIHAELSIECLHAKSLADCLTKHMRPPPSDELGNPRS